MFDMTTLKIQSYTRFGLLALYAWQTAAQFGWNVSVLHLYQCKNLPRTSTQTK